MFKQYCKLVILAGISLIAMNCSKQSPTSIQSESSYNVGEVGNMAPIELKTVANLQAGSGQLFLIMKAGDGRVYYKYGTYNNFSATAWINSGYTATSNIVALNCGNVSWLVFINDQNLLITLSNLQDAFIFSYRDYYVALNNPPIYTTWSINSEIAAVPYKVLYGLDVPMIFGRMSDNKLYSCLPAGITSTSPQLMSNTTVGYKIAAATVSSPYGTTGLIKVFATNSSGNLLTIDQTASYSSGSPYGTWQNTYTNLGGNIPDGANIVVGKNQAGYLEAFACNGANYICHTYQTGASATSWSGWSQMSPACQIWGNFSIGTNADGRLELFFVSTPGVLGGPGDSWVAHQWQTVPNGGWGSPTILTGADGQGLSPIEAGSICVTTNATTNNGPQKQYVFTVSNMNSTDSILYTSQVAPNSGWTTWSMFY